MANDPLAGFDEFMRQQTAPVEPVIDRFQPPWPLPIEPPVIQPIRTTPPSHRITITRLHLPFGDVLRFTVQMTAASLVIGVGLWIVTFLLMLLFGVGVVGLGWLAR